MNSIEKTLYLLEILKTQRDGIRISDLSEKLDMPIATVHRMLSALVKYKYVKQDADSKKYSLGFMFLDMSKYILDSMDLRKLSKPYLTDLAYSSKEACHLSVLDGYEIVFIDRVESTYMISSSHKIGMRCQAYMSASGKAILAAMPQNIMLGLVDKMDFTQGNGKMIQSKEALLKELEIVREKNYAIDNEEVEIGGRCVGAAILDYNCFPVAGVSISGPSTRMDLDYLENCLAVMVVDTARKISDAVSGVFRW